MSIRNNFPTIRPSLSLDFANVKALDPRITFTRTTTATYYDGKTTAKAEENLLLQSQDFTVTGVWDNFGTTDVANSTTAPDDTTTADTLIATATTEAHRIAQTTASVTGSQRVMSIFVKAGTNNYVQIAFGSDVNAYANFDVTSGSGAVGTVGSSASASIVPFANGWYRCIVNTSSATASNLVSILLITSAAASRFESWTALGTETILLWGAQLEQR